MLLSSGSHPRPHSPLGLGCTLTLGPALGCFPPSAMLWSHCPCTEGLVCILPPLLTVLLDDHHDLSVSTSSTPSTEQMARMHQPNHERTQMDDWSE